MHVRTPSTLLELLRFGKKSRDDQEGVPYRASGQRHRASNFFCQYGGKIPTKTAAKPTPAPRVALKQTPRARPPCRVNNVVARANFVGPPQLQQKDVERERLWITSWVGVIRCDGGKAGVGDHVR